MNCIEFTCKLKNIYTLLAQSFVCLKFDYRFIDNPTKYSKESDADIFFSNFWCVFNIYTVSPKEGVCVRCMFFLHFFSILQVFQFYCECLSLSFPLLRECLSCKQN